MAKLLNAVMFIAAILLLASLTTAYVDPTQSWIKDQVLSQFMTNFEQAQTDAIPVARDESKWFDHAWVSGVTMESLIQLYGANSTEIGDILARYERNVSEQLREHEPQSGFSIYLEPEWTITGALREGQYCRQQVHGAALRVINRAYWAIWQIRRGLVSQVKASMWKDAVYTLKGELDYLKDQYTMGTTTCDIYEEISAEHFLNHMVLRKAYLWGAIVAYDLDQQDYGFDLLKKVVTITDRLNTTFISNNRIRPMTNIKDGSSTKRPNIVYDTAVMQGLLYGDFSSFKTEYSFITYGGELVTKVTAHYKAKCAKKQQRNNNNAHLAAQFKDIMPFLKNDNNEDDCEMFAKIVDTFNAYQRFDYVAAPRLNNGTTISTVWDYSQWAMNNMPYNKILKDMSTTQNLGPLMPRYSDDSVTTNAPSIVATLNTAEVLIRSAMAIINEQKLEISAKLGPALLFYFDLAALKYSSCSASERKNLVSAIEKAGEAPRISEYSYYWKCVSTGMLHQQRNMVYGLTQAFGVPMDWQELFDPKTLIQLGAHFNTQSYAAFLSWSGRFKTVSWPL